jgi:hypothetical protein
MSRAGKFKIGRVVEAGAVNCLQKPVDPDTFKGLLEESGLSC